MATSTGLHATTARPGGGTVFKLTPGGTLTTLYRFSFFGLTGDLAMALLTEGSDGNFYGTTSRGGTTTIDGTLFRITPGGTLTTLHNFGEDFDDTDGTNPQAKLLLGSDGKFYGTTMNGGSAVEAPYSKPHPTVPLHSSIRLMER